MPGTLLYPDHSNSYSRTSTTDIQRHPVSFEFSNTTKDKTVIYRNVQDTMCSPHLVGVILADERTLRDGFSSAVELQKATVLGVVLIENFNISAEQLRRLMCIDLPSAIPPSFTFLTKEGWPVLKQQEKLINASHLINDKNMVVIKKKFDKDRVGVVTTSGDCLGFVFVDFNWHVHQVREALEKQLKDLSSSAKKEYKFIERNGWPVRLSQECLLTLVDVLLGHNMCIQYSDKVQLPSSEISSAPSTQQSNQQSACSTNLVNIQRGQDARDGDNSTSKKLPKLSRSETRTSFKQCNKVNKRKPSKEYLVDKHILLSYVRAEASQHALDLKQALVAMGFSVYLDVHEIKTGTDWQDALNFAVQHCFIFLPLITPMYGKTQWTNREVKLADMLGKIIIPINFLDRWPPECLAIQFASTQYIPWKSTEITEHEQTSDSRAWDPVCVKRVAKHVSDCFCENFIQEKQTVKITSTNVLGSTPTEGENRVRKKSVLSEENMQNSNEMVVISAHPMQKHLVQEIKIMLQKQGYQVWCSLDLLEITESTCSDEGILTNPNTPRELPTIPEGEVFFISESETLSSLTDIKRSSSFHRSETEIDHRPISRLMSQFSDINQVSSMTQEKLDRLRTFQQYVDNAGVVIIVVSEAYTKSTMSHQQVFYCEHRKQMILVKSDTNPVPRWLSMLVGNEMIRKMNNPQFESALKARVKKALNPATSQTPKDAMVEARINYLVNFVKKNLPLLDTCVYIAGSSKFQSHRAEEICRALGKELAKVKNITVVTGGFNGAPDVVAKTFYETKEKIQPNSAEASVVHILPEKDAQDFSSKACQNPDGTFEAPSYGKRIFLGDSVKEREAAAARLFDTCIVIEGGPGAAHEVEEFCWNDHFVIPIISTGGASGGQYGVSVKIFELPLGVSDTDWAVLSEKEATPENVAKAVVNILISLKQSIASHSILETRSDKVKSKRFKRKKTKVKGSGITKDSEEFVTMKTTSSLISLFGNPCKYENDVAEPKKHSDIKKKRNLWQRFLRFFSHKGITSA